MDYDPDKWLSAFESLDLVRRHSGVPEADKAICKRARAGLILARARLLILPEKQAYGSPRDTEYPDADVPKKFWWAEGHEALEANWTLGDFATWIDRREHWRAFGVVFDRAGVEAMLPSQAGSSSIIDWDTFPLAAIPQLEKMACEAIRETWWTWPEAMAWIGRRSANDIATLRYWAHEQWGKGGGDRDPNLILSGQRTIAAGFCKSARDAEASLFAAIVAGRVVTSGRSSRDGPAQELDPSGWRGGRIVWHQGQAVLADGKTGMWPWAFDVVVRREDLLKEFPASDPTQDAQTNMSIDAGGIIAAKPVGDYRPAEGDDMFHKTAWLCHDHQLIFRGDAAPASSESERIANGHKAIQTHVSTLAALLKGGGQCGSFLSETQHYHGGSAHGLPLDLAIAFSEPSSVLTGQQCWAMLMHWSGRPNEPWPGNEPLVQSGERKPPSVAKRGRSRGTGYQTQDRPFVEKALALVNAGQAKSATEAADMIVKSHEKQIVGQSFDAKKDRIRKAVKALERNGGKFAAQ